MDLATLTRDLEEAEIAIQEQQYLQYAGRPWDEGRIDAASAQIEDASREGLLMPRDEVAPALYERLVVGAVAAKRVQLENAIYRARNDRVRTEADGEVVTLNNLRSFQRRHLGDPALRKRVFDDLLEKTTVVTDAIGERLNMTREAYRKAGLDVLEEYLAREQVSLDQLEDLIDTTARRAKPYFEKEHEALAPEVLGKPMEYYDDMYVWRHAAFAPIDDAFGGIDAVATVRRTADALGFDLGGIDIDGEARDGKYASPVVFGVRVPGDVRVLYQETSPFADYTSLYHEMGHALHFASVDAGRAYWERRLIPSGVTEIFSTLFDNLAVDPVYLKEEVGLDDDAIRTIRQRHRFMELFFLTFYGANAYWNVAFWRDQLQTNAAGAVYEHLTEKYMGIRLPGIYWQAHHVLSMSDLYAPSYLLANVRRAELVKELKRLFGTRWWKDPEAGAWLRRECMKPGASIDLQAFSRLDPQPYLRSVIEETA